ncbi:MAG: crossover junction endodeoxyribonuclease RuvC [Candidatus Acidiferrales bacterium]
MTLPAHKNSRPPAPVSPRRALRILGVDPALAGTTGFGVIEVSAVSGAPAKFLHSEPLHFPRKASFATRIREIHEAVARLVAKFSPDAVAVESVFTALNARTALRLAEVRGVVLLAAAQASVPAHSYSPREVKASVAGYGAASKEQMQHMVRTLLGMREPPEPADIADALAVALCHAQCTEARERMARALAPASPPRPVPSSERTRSRAASVLHTR